MDARHYDYEKLKQVRERKGLLASEVARALGVHKNTISRAETGVIASYELLCILAGYYQIPIFDLLKPEPLKKVA